MSEPPYAVESGEFTVFGVKLVCHVLSNSQRVIEGNGLERLLTVMSARSMGQNHAEPGDLEAFMQWSHGK